jgi:hypothetical protein
LLGLKRVKRCKNEIKGEGTFHPKLCTYPLGAAVFGVLTGNKETDANIYHRQTSIHALPPPLFNVV